QRIVGPQSSGGTRHSHGSRLAAALHLATNAGFFARVAGFRRNRRFHFAFTVESKMYPLCGGAIRKGRLFLASYRAGPKTDLRSRRNPRPLFSALPFLET